MGRRPKYRTEEERKVARKESAKRYRLKKKQERVDREDMEAKANSEWNKLMSINPDLYPTRQHLNNEQKDYIKSMMNRPIETVKHRRKGGAIAKKQIGLAMKEIAKSRIGSIDFDMRVMDDEDIEYFFNHIEPVLMALLDKIDLSEHWTVYYEYDGSWKQRTLDTITQSFLKNQLHSELIERKMDMLVDESINSDSNFFPVQVRSLTMLRIVNESVVGTKGETDSTYSINDFKNREAYKAYCMMKKAKSSKQDIAHFLKYALKKRIKVNGGKFWRWYLTINGLNLERYMIFHRLDKRTVQIVNRDNCFIYACRMGGVSDDVIDEMRCCIRKRSFGIRDIKEIASKCNLRFIIKKHDGRNITINNEGETTLKLLLYEDHYMINEKVPIAPFYLKHIAAINRDCRYWKLSDRMLINRYDGKYWRKCDRLYSLRKILKAIFEIDGFKTITSGDFMTFNSTVCFENIDPIKRLEYNVKFCCRLKYDYTTDTQK